MTTLMLDIATMPLTPGSIRRVWYKWKMLRLPWRKRWLIGQ
jgi:NADH dehydrogenase [ubiquinone] 1 alpha subcomplex assembly factor 2